MAEVECNQEDDLWCKIVNLFIFYLKIILKIIIKMN